MTLRPTPVLPLLSLLAAGCWSGSYNKEDADKQVYAILEEASEGVTGARKVFTVERPVDTLRRRLAESPVPVKLSLLEAIDVAAENSREFQRAKESLYLSALNLTRSQWDFSVQFGVGGNAEVNGTGDDSANVALRDDLAASVNSTAGTRVFSSFANSFLRSVMNGGAFDGSSILNLGLTQPIMRGAGTSIAREPLTQSERDVVYQMRDFERFRATFAVQVVSSYYQVVRQMADLKSVEASYRSFVQNRELTQEYYAAGRKTITDLGRALQSEYSAEADLVTSKNALATALDRFKILLGIPTTAQVELDGTELDRLVAAGVTPLELDSDTAVKIALARRYDHRNIVDEVEDAGRRVMVSEDALNIILDFSGALSVPAQDGNGLNLDWSKVNWSAGFDLDLALDKLPERNAYRSSLIQLDVAIRARELSEDEIAAEIRSALRDIQSAFDSYRIQLEAVRLAEQRVEATLDLYVAGRVQAIERLDAQDSLLSAQLALSRAIVQYSIARIELLRDLEGLALEPRGLRYDPALPLPSLPTPPATQEKP